MDVQLTFSYKEFGRFDLVVVGGGCTGVFAAIRAARQGLRVAIVEKSNCFGGVATNGLVNIWHSLYDIYGKEQIIRGLTDEVRQTLIKDGAAEHYKDQTSWICYDPNAMKLALDNLVMQHGIKIFFHTFYNTVLLQDDLIQGIVVSNKDGMGVIYADFFIDASGDGDLCRDVGLSSYVSDALQPPSPCCLIRGKIQNDIGMLVKEHADEFGLEDDWGWHSRIPGVDDIYMRADFHIFSKLCNRADDLTEAEIEGRRKMYAFASLLKKYDAPDHDIVALCSHIGIRETVHYETNFKACEKDLLMGKSYEDTIMRGTYRVDIHHQNDHGITFKYLDGRTISFYGKGNEAVYGNWMKDAGIEMSPAPYYQIPFRILQQNKIGNLIPVGRMLNADDGAFGALRVMVNLNQLGEAAGVAAYVAVNEKKKVADISGVGLKKYLMD